MTRYRIIPERSRVWIDARSNRPPHPLEHRRARRLRGARLRSEGRVDLEHAPAGKLSLPVSRLSSGNRMEDREMQKRIDARRYPTIDGVLDGIERSTATTPPTRSAATSLSGEWTDLTRTDDDQSGRRRDDRARREVPFDIREFGMEPPRVLLLKVLARSGCQGRGRRSERGS